MVKLGTLWFGQQMVKFETLCCSIDGKVRDFVPCSVDGKVRDFAAGLFSRW